MGKPSNNQTTQRATASEAYDPRAEQVELERATPPIKTQAKLDSGSTLTASLTSRPASPSVESARHETAQSSPALDGHDDMPHGVPASFADEPSVLSAPKSQRASGLQKALAQVSVDAVTVDDDDDDDDDDVFFDALEYLTPPTAPTTPAAPTPKHQRAIGIQQAPYDPELEGAPKGRTTVPPRGARPPRSAAAFASPPSSAFAHLGRGPSSSVAAPPPLGQPPAPHAIPRPSAPAKKGLLVGVNYDRSDEKNKLKYAVRDAKRFGQVLAKTLGFPEENLVFITDEERPVSSYHYGTPGHVGHVVHQPNVAPATERWQGYVHHEGKRRFVQPSHYNFIRGCQWLTKDAKAGDELIMLFSGHCVMHNGQPYLVMPDGFISKRDLYRELVSKVPQGCRFTFVPDCCHSAALVDLPYCVGKMGPKPASTEPQEVTVTPGPSACPTDKPAPESERSLQTSLYGVRPGVIMHEPEPAVVTEHLIPPGYNTEPFAPPSVSTAAKRQVSVVAAPAPAPVAAASTWIPAWLSGTVTPNEPVPVTLEAASTAATGTGVRRTRNCVVEATRPTDYFEERKAGFDPPAGDVTVWAAAGAGQYAFEASGKVKHGIVTNALCNALESCENISYRDLWGRIQDAIESENVYRHSRDQAKDESQREAPEKRVQHAEMWVSRRERLSCAAAVLDGRAFCPVVATPLPKADVVAAGANLGARTRSFTSFMAQPHGTSV